MFTGIVEEMGEVIRLEPGKGHKGGRLWVKASRVLEDVRQGDSIAVDGVCLTVVEYRDGWFAADVMEETLRRSALGTLAGGSRVNLERAMAADGRFGGHMVSGHIDGIGVVRSREQEGEAVLLRIEAAPKLLECIVEKGSVAVDGVSLTVASVDRQGFCVSLIPHTGRSTALLDKNAGEPVNLENDMIAKYVRRLLRGAQEEERESHITMEFLERCGF